MLKNYAQNFQVYFQPFQCNSFLECALQKKKLEDKTKTPINNIEVNELISNNLFVRIYWSSNRRRLRWAGRTFRVGIRPSCWAMWRLAPAAGSAVVYPHLSSLQRRRDHAPSPTPSPSSLPVSAQSATSVDSTVSWQGEDKRSPPPWILASRKILHMSEKILPKMQNMKLQIHRLRKFWESVKVLSTHYLLYPKFATVCQTNCSLLRMPLSRYFLTCTRPTPLRRSVGLNPPATHVQNILKLTV